MWRLLVWRRGKEEKKSGAVEHNECSPREGEDSKKANRILLIVERKKRRVLRSQRKEALEARRCVGRGVGAKPSRIYTRCLDELA